MVKPVHLLQSHTEKWVNTKNKFEFPSTHGQGFMFDMENSSICNNNKGNSITLNTNEKLLSLNKSATHLVADKNVFCKEHERGLKYCQSTYSGNRHRSPKNAQETYRDMVLN